MDYRITLLGEKDHGKSTLLGNLLIKTGSIKRSRINSILPSSIGGKRFEPGYLLDSFKEERDRGMTIDQTSAEIIYKNNLLHMTDVPGHLELLKNMLTGASNASLGIFVVSAKMGEGFTNQSKRHLYLSNLMGIGAMLVAVNKMDMADFKEKAFIDIKKSITDYCSAAGIKSRLVFVPISAYNMENVIERAKNMQWYDGKPLMRTLLEMLEHINPGIVEQNGMRILIQDKIDDAFFGQVLYGKIKNGSDIILHPGGKKVRLFNLKKFNKVIGSSKAPSNIYFKLNPDANASRGDILYGIGEHPSAEIVFNAKIFPIKNISAYELSKSKVSFNGNYSNVAMRITGIFDITKAAKVPKRKNAAITPNYAINMAVKLAKKCPTEHFNAYPILGRFGMYSKSGILLGVGIVE